MGTHATDHKSGEHLLSLSPFQPLLLRLNKSPLRKENADDSVAKNYYDLDDRID